MTPEEKSYVEEVRKDSDAAISQKWELVHGDVIHRTKPGSRLVLNTGTSWLVSSGDRSGFKVIQSIPFYNNAKETVNRLIQIIERQEKVIEKMREGLKKYSDLEHLTVNGTPLVFDRGSMARQTLEEVDGL